MESIYSVVFLLSIFNLGVEIDFLFFFFVIIVGFFWSTSTTYSVSADLIAGDEKFV